MSAKTLAELAADCKHAGPVSADRVKVSSVCGSRGLRVPVFYCSYYKRDATRRRYALAQRELCCERCPVITEKLNETA
jgi:hypothetical protein